MIDALLQYNLLIMQNILPVNMFHYVNVYRYLVHENHYKYNLITNMTFRYPEITKKHL